MGKRKSTPQTVASRFGLAALGLIVLIVGTLVKSHFALNAAVCNTFGGATSQCVANGTAFTIGQVMQPLGGFMIGIGVILGALQLFAGTGSRRSIGSRTTAIPSSPSQAGPTPSGSSDQGGRPSAGATDAAPADDKSNW